MPEVFKGDISPKQEEWKPKPAESFLAEFNSGKLQKVTSIMSELGFSFRRGNVDADSEASVSFEGERSWDGTKITITFDKGENYQSPKEIDDERAAREKNELPK